MALRSTSASGCHVSSELRDKPVPIDVTVIDEASLDYRSPRARPRPGGDARRARPRTCRVIQLASRRTGSARLPRTWPSPCAMRLTTCDRPGCMLVRSPGGRKGSQGTARGPRHRSAETAGAREVGRSRLGCFEERSRRRRTPGPYVAVDYVELTPTSSKPERSPATRQSSRSWWNALIPGVYAPRNALPDIGWPSLL